MIRKHTPEQISELARELTQVKRSNPILTLYHWRYEIAALAAIPYALYQLFDAAGVFWSLIILAGLTNMVFYWRAARRFVRGRLRTIVVQHRLRTAFARARVCTLDGRRPAILWTKPRGDDVSVLLFCPAGIGFERIHASRDLLASACFAAEVFVERHPRFAHLITLDVCTARLRRDPDDLEEPAIA
jgi:hypothetical protein